MRGKLRALFLRVLWGAVALQSVAAASAHAVEARVRVGLEAQGDVWVGQQVGLTIDLMSNGLSFGKQRMHLPDIPRALVLEDAVATVNLSEQVQGETWQVLRYSYPMFVQRAGRIEVPPFRVSFQVSQGYGSTAMAFDLETAALALNVRRPPGVTALERLVSTDRFTVVVLVTPDTDDLQVGDALTRTVTRMASGVSGMAFAPLPVPDLVGATAYPKTPEVADSHYRGALEGSRVDAVTFVLQTAGELTLPGMEFEWWDPAAAVLHTETVPELHLSVAPNPAVATVTDAEVAAPPGGIRLWVLAVALGLSAALLWAGVRWAPVAVHRIARWRLARRHSEAGRYREVLRACRRNDPGGGYNAYQKWVAACQARQLTSSSAADLIAELERVQTALVLSDSSWDGRALAGAMRRARRGILGTARRVAPAMLPELNPGR